MLTLKPSVAVEAHLPSMRDRLSEFSIQPDRRQSNLRRMANIYNQDVEPRYSYDYILFYRWLSPDLYERGRVMARLVAEVIEKNSRRIWLDQHQMTRTTEAVEVTKRISKTFHSVSQIIILAAPGDWNRFTNPDDIHRWEWEMSLLSDKQIWLLHYGLPDNGGEASKEQLAKGLETYCPRLAELFMGRDVHLRSLSMDNIDVVLREIAEAR